MKTATIEELSDLALRLRDPQGIFTGEERAMLADWLDASAREAAGIRDAVQSHIDYLAACSLKV